MELHQIGDGSRSAGNDSEPRAPSGETIPSPPPAARPRAVTAVVVALGLTALVILWMLSTEPLRDLFAHGLREWPLLFTWLGFAWTCIFCLACCRPLYTGRRWAWSAVSAVLFVRSAVAAASIAVFVFAIALVARRHSYHLSDLLPTGLLTAYGWIVFALLLALVRGRSWFGVERRHGWRTMFREGG